MLLFVDCEKFFEIVFVQIDCQFGKGLVMWLGSDECVFVVVILIGFIVFDVVFGVGGFLCGCIVEIYGLEFFGKMMLILYVIVNVQCVGGIVVFIDVEYVFDFDYVVKFGVDIDVLLVFQFDIGEQVFEIVDMFVWFGVIDFIVIDLVVVLVLCVEIEGEMGDLYVGLQVCFMLQVLWKFIGGLNQMNIMMIFINQLCEKIGVFFGLLEIMVGGKVLKFYVLVCMDICCIEMFKDGIDVVGNCICVKVVKNKMVLLFKQVEFDIFYGVGILWEGSLIDFGVEYVIVKKLGLWYIYDGDQLGQGKENVCMFLFNNFDIVLVIEMQIKQKFGIGGLVVVLVVDEFVECCLV